MSKEKWNPDSYLENVDFKKGDWSLYMRTEDHDPFFAINVDGRVFFKGKLVDMRPKVGKELMEAMIPDYFTRDKDDEITGRTYGIYIAP